MSGVSYFWNFKRNDQNNQNLSDEQNNTEEAKNNISDINMANNINVIKPIVTDCYTQELNTINVNSDNHKNSKNNQFELIEIKVFNEQDKNTDIASQKEELEKLGKLLQDLNTLKEINEDLIVILGEQKQNINSIEKNVIEANEIIESSNLQLLDADKQNVATTGTKLTMSTVGTAVVGSVALTVGGWKIGLVLGAVAFIGGAAWAILPPRK